MPVKAKPETNRNKYSIYSHLIRFDCFSFASIKLSRGGVFPTNKRIRAEPTTCTVSFGSFVVLLIVVLSLIS